MQEQDPACRLALGLQVRHSELLGPEHVSQLVSHNLSKSENSLKPQHLLSVAVILMRALSVESMTVVVVSRLASLNNILQVFAIA
jgi:hypothetical protein